MQGEIGGLNLELCPLVLNGVYGLFVFFITMLGFGGLWMERWPSDHSLKHARGRYAGSKGCAGGEGAVRDAEMNDRWTCKCLDGQQCLTENARARARRMREGCGVWTMRHAPVKSYMRDISYRLLYFVLGVARCG